MQINIYMALLETFAQFSRQKLVTFLVLHPEIHGSIRVVLRLLVLHVIKYQSREIFTATNHLLTNACLATLIINLLPCWYLQSLFGNHPPYLTVLFNEHRTLSALPWPVDVWNNIAALSDLALICCIHRAWTAILQTEREGKTVCKKHDCIFLTDSPQTGKVGWAAAVHCSLSARFMEGTHSSFSYTLMIQDTEDSMTLLIPASHWTFTQTLCCSYTRWFSYMLFANF